MADPSGKSPSGAQEAPRRYYALFPPQGELLELYRRGELKAIIAFFQQEFAKAGFRHLAATSFEVSLPAPRWRFVGDLPGKGDAAAGAAAPDVGKVAPGDFDPARLLLAYEFDDPSWGPEFLAFLDKWLVGVEKPIVGVDLRLDFAEHWCPSEATSPIFGTRRDAGRLIDVDGLARHGCTGERVNVVIVDEGLDAALIPNFGGGWISGGGAPGTTKRGHGVMVARNALQAAPQARLFDCRIIPERIGTVGHFMSDVQAAVQQMLIDIALHRLLGYWREPWVFVNAWALFQASQDPDGNYSRNPLHPINLLIDFIDAQGHDIVFAAGNCGQFCPNSRCDWDAGPGNTILGANSHPKVLTVGAVRTDGLWLGYSSQRAGSAGAFTWQSEARRGEAGPVRAEPVLRRRRRARLQHRHQRRLRHRGGRRRGDPNHLPAERAFAGTAARSAAEDGQEAVRAAVGRSARLRRPRCRRRGGRGDEGVSRRGRRLTTPSSAASPSLNLLRRSASSCARRLRTLSLGMGVRAREGSRR